MPNPMAVAVLAQVAGQVASKLFGGGGGPKGPNVFPMYDAPGGVPSSARLGQNLAAFLNERLMTPAGETDTYRMLSTALSEATANKARTARQRSSDAFLAQGAFDSGERFNALADIDRSELEEFGRGIREILFFLEQQRTQDVLPFLQAAAAERLGVAGAKQAAKSSQQQFGLNLSNQFSSLLAQQQENQSNSDQTALLQEIADALRT